MPNTDKNLTNTDDYLNRLFLKYWHTDVYPADDGKDGLYLYPDKLIWDLHYTQNRFPAEEALKLRKFLLVPGIEELVNKGLFNMGELQTCRFLTVDHAAKLVKAYQANPNAWQPILSPKLSELIFWNGQSYDVKSLDEVRTKFGKQEAVYLMKSYITENFEYSYYNQLRHILSFRSDLPIIQLQQIANQLSSVGLNIKATAGSPNLFSTFNFPARIEINNSYEEIIRFLMDPKQRLDNKGSVVDTSKLDAINDIRESIATVLSHKRC